LAESPDWLEIKNADAPAGKREAEEDSGKHKWRSARKIRIGQMAE
jgi:hypothetical protein